MGKTEKGALWLDATKTSPYEFYQYFRNVDDPDVKNCLSLLTFLPMHEIEALTAYKDERINAAKEKLAYEVTKLIHGQDEAEKAQTAARALFSDGVSDENMPSTACRPKDRGGRRYRFSACRLRAGGFEIRSQAPDPAGRDCAKRAKSRKRGYPCLRRRFRAGSLDFAQRQEGLP
jgi:tyrosyl-tRNA synthetase